MIWLEDRSAETGEIYLHASSPEDLRKCIEWLTKQLEEAIKYNKQTWSIFDNKNEAWLEWLRDWEIKKERKLK